MRFQRKAITPVSEEKKETNSEVKPVEVKTEEGFQGSPDDIALTESVDVDTFMGDADDFSDAVDYSNEDVSVAEPETVSDDFDIYDEYEDFDSYSTALDGSDIGPDGFIAKEELSVEEKKNEKEEDSMPEEKKNTVVETVKDVKKEKEGSLGDRLRAVHAANQHIKNMIADSLMAAAENDDLTSFKINVDVKAHKMIKKWLEGQGLTVKEDAKNPNQLIVEWN